MLKEINWTNTTLGDISVVKGQYGANEPSVKLIDGKPRYIRITDIDEEGLLIEKNAVGAEIENIDTFLVEENDLLFVRTGATTGKCYLHKEKDKKFTFAGFLIKFKINEEIAKPYYVWSITKTARYNKWVSVMSVRSGQPGINSVEYSKLNLLLPPINEQEKIAEILSTWDDAIKKLSNTIHEEKRKKKSIVSRIYRGHISKKIEGTIKYSRLKNNITEVTIRNKEDNKLVLSVSNSKGFIPQSEQFDREVASKNRSNYKIIKKTQFAYNPSRINVGSIDMLTSFESGILSPMYVVFETKDNLNSRYLYHFLKSDLFLQIIPRYTQGSVRDSLSFKGLSSMKIYLPELEEQNLYAEALDTIDYYIEKLEKLKELYKAQKQGLMQQLLTGKIRVNLN